MCSSAFSLDVVGIYFVMLEQVFKSLAKVWSIDFPFVCYAGYSCVLYSVVTPFSLDKWTNITFISTMMKAVPIYCSLKRIFIIYK